MDIKISLPYENISDGVSFLRQCSVRETFRLHTHDFYEFFYIVRGKAIHEINGENQILSEGDFVLVRPWDEHKYSFLDNFDMEIISVGFSCENFNSALNMLEISEDVFTKSAMPPVINLYGYNLTDIYRNYEMYDGLEHSYSGKCYCRDCDKYLGNNLKNIVGKEAENKIIERKKKDIFKQKKIFLEKGVEIIT